MILQEMIPNGVVRHFVILVLRQAPHPGAVGALNHQWILYCSRIASRKESTDDPVPFDLPWHANAVG